MQHPIRAAAALALVALAGCVAPDAASDPLGPEGNPSGQSLEGPGSTRLDYAGTLEADACTETSRSSTCDSRIASLVAANVANPPPHTVWHKVALASPVESITLKADWQWHEPGETTFYIALVCQDRHHDPCVDGEDNVAEATGASPVITVEDQAFSFFDPDAHSLWLYFGVEPRRDAAGEHYPRVHVDYDLAVLVGPS